MANSWGFIRGSLREAQSEPWQDCCEVPTDLQGDDHEPAASGQLDRVDGRLRVGPDEFARDRSFRGHDRPETRSKHKLLAEILANTPKENVLVAEQNRLGAEGEGFKIAMNMKGL